MLVSVIIPNYNHEPFLHERIDSVLNQTFVDFEVIILDDCSSDSSRLILEQYETHPKVSHFILNERNSGSTFKQWNRGINLAKGEWIWIAESDDVADPDFLSTLVDQIGQHQNLSLAFCQSYKMNDKGEVTGSWLNWTDEFDKKIFLSNFTMNGQTFIEKFLIHKNILPNASALIFRRDVYTKVGGVNENIQNCSDWELWLKILLISDVLYIGQHLNYFRYHEQSVIAKVHASRQPGVYGERFDRAMRQEFQKYLLSISNSNHFKEIKAKNLNYIFKENIYEGLYQILQQKENIGWTLLKKSTKDKNWFIVITVSLKILIKESFLRVLKEKI